MANELTDLVNNPEERLHVELKSWLDLSEPKHRADLARHICAISNFGGGYIVFGFDDTKAPCGKRSQDFRLDHDSVASITKKYLDPSVHCDVRKVTSDLGNEHLIVVIPPHSSTPICAKANGPEINGKIQGIVAGWHYTRKPGPESVAIANAADWKDIIRRCALHDRSAILAAVTAALADTTSSIAQEKTEILPLWAEAANQTYVKLIGDKEFKVPLHDCRIQFTYIVHTAEPETLPHKEFTNLLRQLCFEVDQEVSSGWSLFYVFDVRDKAPNWKSDPNAGIGDVDFLESNLVNPDRTFGFDFWRVAPTGVATTIREYWEDSQNFATTPRSILSPILMERALFELVRHAEVFSSRFTTPLRVEFCCEWSGLRGRRLTDPNSPPFFSSKPATMDKVRTQGTWAVGKLATEKPQIVAELGSRVARAFDWHDFTPQWVKSQKLYRRQS